MELSLIGDEGVSTGVIVLEGGILYLCFVKFPSWTA